MNYFSVILLLTLLLSCGEENMGKKFGTVEVYDYYSNGSLKSIGNYRDGKYFRRQAKYEFGEFRILETADYKEVKQLMDSLGIPPEKAGEAGGYVAMMSEAERNGNQLGLMSAINSGQIPGKGYFGKSMAILDLNKLQLIPRIYLMWCEEPEIIDNQRFYKLYAVKIPKENEPRISNRDVHFVEKEEQESGAHSLSIILTEKGAKNFSKLTRKNIKRTLAIVFGDVVYSAPLVLNKIDDGRMEISGNFTTKEVETFEKLIGQRILNGEFREYHKNGRLKAISTYENGELTGERKRYDEKGKPLKNNPKN